LLATIQKVSEAEVVINGRKYSSIKDGVLIFVCIEEKDVSETTKEMANKIFNFKMLDGPNGITSASLKDLEEEILIISQFTLAAITNKGNKPSFHKAANPGDAKLLYDKFIAEFKELSNKVSEGKFGAFMEVSMVNKGPVTFNFNI
jgi:D-tyrosyl-tRNA(Tyr) deacylase